MRKHHGIEYVGMCPRCQKKCYTTRKRAKAAAKFYHPGEKNLNAYPCGEYWHYGHLAYSTLKGWNPR